MTEDRENSRSVARPVYFGRRIETTRSREIGLFGEILRCILETYSLVQPVMAFELDVEPLRSSR